MSLKTKLQSFTDAILVLQGYFSNGIAANAAALGGSAADLYATKTYVSQQMAGVGSGNVVAPSSSVANHVTGFADTTGKILVDLGAADSAATVSAFVKRDSAGRAKFVDPAAAQDVATKNYADGTYTKNNPGFVKLPAGIIIQWGIASIGAGDNTVSFQNSFTTSPAVVLSPVGSSAGSIKSVTASTFIVAVTAPSTFNWVAVGY